MKKKEKREKVWKCVGFFLIDSRCTFPPWTSFTNSTLQLFTVLVGSLLGPFRSCCTSTAYCLLLVPAWLIILHFIYCPSVNVSFTSTAIYVCSGKKPTVRSYYKQRPHSGVFNFFPCPVHVFHSPASVPADCEWVTWVWVCFSLWKLLLGTLPPVTVQLCAGIVLLAAVETFYFIFGSVVRLRNSLGFLTSQHEVHALRQPG